MVKGGKSPGPPPKWREDNIERLRAAAKKKPDKPWTNKEIASLFGIVPSTLHRWIDDRPDLKEAIEEIRERADDEVENKFFENCRGYYKEDTKTTYDADGNVLRVEVTRKWYPSSVTAQLAWLRHRRPKEWSESALESADVNTLDGLIVELSKARAKMLEKENT